MQESNLPIWGTVGSVPGREDFTCHRAFSPVCLSTDDASLEPCPAAEEAAAVKSQVPTAGSSPTLSTEGPCTATETFSYFQFRFYYSIYGQATNAAPHSLSLKLFHRGDPEIELIRLEYEALEVMRYFVVLLYEICTQDIPGLLSYMPTEKLFHRAFRLYPSLGNL